MQYSYNFYDSLTEKLERKSGLRETYEYYPDGSIKSAIAEGMRYSYSYYTNGSLKEKSASGKRLLSYEYDLNGNKIKQTDVTGKTTEYIYNELDQLLEIHDGGKCITAFKYNDDGTIKEAVSANGMKNLYGYDTDKNLTSLSVNFNGEILAKNRYAYDSNGNRTIKRQLRGTTAKHYIYDNAGNLMNDGERIYKNDAFNRVTRVETTTGQVQINRYDAEGLRYEMEENKKLVQFIFNENREVVVEQSSSDIKRLIRSYDLWASECEPEKTWYHYASDEQGSTIFITDEEKICNKYDYDAWGNLTTCEEIIPNRFLYAGQQFDQIIQQYYLRARFYNPVIARFTKEDVYRGDGLNLYTYCDNNPVIYYDPSGYSACNGPGDKNPIEKKKLLPKEGEVGTYKDLIKNGEKGDNVTPHHMPAADYMKSKGVSKNDGVAMNVEAPYPGEGGRHRQTRSYGKKSDLNETPREALARDINDMRKIYKNDELYTPEIRKSLKEVIKLNKELYPDLFEK